MGKLVRDRIPQIIEASGGSAEVRVLDDEEYDAALLDKLVEEVEELRAAAPGDRLEEAADVYEVLLAILGRMGLDSSHLVETAEVKRQSRGGFHKRMWWEG